MPAGFRPAERWPVDRDAFSAMVTSELRTHPLISFVEEEIVALPPVEWGETIVATGPLTSEALIAAIFGAYRQSGVTFYDAIAAGCL